MAQVSLAVTSVTASTASILRPSTAASSPRRPSPAATGRILAQTTFAGRILAQTTFNGRILAQTTFNGRIRPDDLRRPHPRPLSMGCCRSKGKDKGKDYGGEETEQSDDFDDGMIWDTPQMPAEGLLPAPSQRVGYESGGPISPKTGRKIKRTHSENFEGCMTPRR